MPLVPILQDPISVLAMKVTLVTVECAPTSTSVMMVQTTVLPMHPALIWMAVSHVFAILGSKVMVLLVKISMNASMGPTNVISILNAQIQSVHMIAVVMLDSKVMVSFVLT